MDQSDPRSIDLRKAEWRKRRTLLGSGTTSPPLLRTVVRDGKRGTELVDAGARVLNICEFDRLRRPLFESHSLLLIHERGRGGGWIAS